MERGALLQITARSLLDGDGRATKRCSLRLLEFGMVGLVASDAHSARSTWPGAVQDIIEAAVGRDQARRILFDNPRAILAGLPIPATNALQKPRRSGLWAKLRKLSG